MISTWRSVIGATRSLTGMSMGRLPARTIESVCMLVDPAWACGQTPMRSVTSAAGPNRSTACPPGRSAGARSTTVGLKPYRRSQ